MSKSSHKICICRLHKEHWQKISEDLISRGFEDVFPMIPTIGILRKKRGHSVPERIPLFFNYGFIRVPSKKAFDREYMRKLRTSIPGITSWVNSPEPLHDKKIRRRIDNAEDWDDFSQVATISEEELHRYMDIAAKNQIFSFEDITSVKIGDYVTMRGYPFEGMGAVIREIHLSTKTVDVTLIPNPNTTLNIQVPMENVFYSVYHDFDDNVFGHLEVDFQSDFLDPDYERDER